MANLGLIILIIVAFLLIIVFSSRDHIDMMVVYLLLGFSVALIVSFVIKKDFSLFLARIPYETIIYLIFFDILIQIINQEHLFEYIVVKIIHLTKSRIRLFYYTLSIFSALVSAVMIDITVAVIFIPIVHRATKILKIESRPFVLAVALSISIGNLLTPYSTAVNIIIASSFGIPVIWFIKYLFLFFVIIEAGTLIYIDLRYLEKQNPPTEQAKRILLDIMDPELIVVNKSRFIRHSIYFLIILVFLFLNISPYLILLIGVMIVCIIERKRLADFFKNVDWMIPCLLIGLFLLIACLIELDITLAIERFISSIIGENIIGAILLTIGFTAIIGSFISKNVAAVIFLTILSQLFQDVFTSDIQQNLLLLSLLIGINVGGNMIPQASSHVLYTLDFVKKNNILHIDFKSYSKITLILCLGYCLIGVLYILAYLAMSMLF